MLLLDGRGKKIHLRNGVVKLRNALGLHALPERIVSRCRAIDPVGDNRVLNKQQQQQQHTNATDDVAREEDGVGRSATAEIVARKPDATVAATRSNIERYRFDPARSRC